MYQQQHLKVNWGTYHVPPTLHPPQGFYLSPRCAPSVLHLPSKVYSLCSPVGPRNSRNNNPPPALIPTLMTVHPPGQRGPPVIGLSPIVQGPPPMIQRGPHRLRDGQTVMGDQGTSPKAPPGFPPVEHRRVSVVEGRQTLQNSSRNHHTIPSVTVENLSVKVITGDAGSSPSVGKKRSASPSDNERKQKRQRDISQSPEVDCKLGQQNSLFTPVKLKETLYKSLSDKDKEVGRKLTGFIEDLYKRHKQTDEMLRQKMELRNVLHIIIQSIYPQCGLYMVGSSMTGVAANSSDLDLCLVLCQSEINQQTEAIVCLREVLKKIRQCNFIRQLELIHAKVPILKFKDSVSKVEVDLNVNNVVGIRNTQLLNNYGCLDQRVRPLCLLVKLWAKAQDINDPFNRTLSSYSLILMVLHYLQVGCDPPVLPCLHKMMPHHFSTSSDVRSLSLTLDLPAYNVRNNQCLGELLLGFFNYYGYVFNFQEEAISVRTGGCLPKQLAMSCRSPKNKPSQWNFICIEEPFDRTNTAYSVFDKGAFNRIRNAFVRSVETLRKTPDLELLISKS